MRKNDIKVVRISFASFLRQSLVCFSCFFHTIPFINRILLNNIFECRINHFLCRFEGFMWGSLNVKDSLFLEAFQIGLNPLFFVKFFFPFQLDLFFRLHLMLNPQPFNLLLRPGNLLFMHFHMCIYIELIVPQLFLQHRRVVITFHIATHLPLNPIPIIFRYFRL